MCVFAFKLIKSSAANLIKVNVICNHTWSWNHAGNYKQLNILTLVLITTIILSIYHLTSTDTTFNNKYPLCIYGYFLPSSEE
jgi:hypothetical protein